MNDTNFRQTVVEIAAELSRRQQALTTPARVLHQQIVRYFAETGEAPAPATLHGWAAELGTSTTDGLAALVGEDLIECDLESGGIQGAYPFVGHAVGHTVQIAGGVAVEAYCAIDSLGISAMLGQDVKVTSHDPHNGEPVAVDVHGATATWWPTEAVVTLPAKVDTARRLDGGVGQAGQVSCPTVNFFTSVASAKAYALKHGVGLEILTMTQALELGGAAFGPLLASANEP